MIPIRHIETIPFGTELQTTFHSLIVVWSSGTPAWSSILSAPASTQAGKIVCNSLALCRYLIAAAAGGQAASQLPQPMHKLSMISKEDGIASVGQTGIHKLHLTQESLSINAFLTWWSQAFLH